MTIEKYIADKRATLLGRWFQLVIDTYPPDTVQFLKRQKDAMANPVGSSTRDGLDGILKELAQGGPCERFAPFLDRIIRIRAVQSFTPSQAVGFVPGLKGIIRDVLGKEIEEKGLAPELTALDARIEELTLLAFDLYVACRDKLNEIRLNDEKRRLHMLLRRANLLCETEEETHLPDFRDGDQET